MHTYLKYKDCYSVGMWLPNREGVTAFMRMFDVADLEQAQAAVSYLNGGDGSFTVTKEH